MKLNHGLDDSGEILIQCVFCGHRFFLGDAPGSAGITVDGEFIGKCPQCGVNRLNEGIDVKHSEEQVEDIVVGLELASDNLCQRVVDLLWLRNWRARFKGVMQ